MCSFADKCSAIGTQTEAGSLQSVREGCRKEGSQWNLEGVLEPDFIVLTLHLCGLTGENIIYFIFGFGFGFEERSCCIAQAGLMYISLPQPLQDWDYRYLPPHPCFHYIWLLNVPGLSELDPTDLQDLTQMRLPCPYTLVLVPV